MKIIKFLLKLPIYFYKIFISPLLPHTCRFYPTCSSYFIMAVNEFGIKGIAIGANRLMRCRPNNKQCGYDPLPINIKGDAKWLF